MHANYLWFTFFGIERSPPFSALLLFAFLYTAQRFIGLPDPER
ncbi:MAG: hypothetical protein U0787_04790 [Polyangia bacterium]